MPSMRGLLICKHILARIHSRRISSAIKSYILLTARQGKDGLERFKDLRCFSYFPSQELHITTGTINLGAQLCKN